MFVAMEENDELLKWKERLDKLAKGKAIQDVNANTIYSTINRHFPKESGKKFGVRTHPVTLKKSVIRIK